MVEASGLKAKNPEVFMEVLRDRKRFLEVDIISIYNMDKVEC